MRIRFSSYQATSTARPTNPRSMVKSSATTTSVWPRSSLLRRIERHDRGVGHVQRREAWNEVAQRRAAAVGVVHRDAGGVRRADVVSTARGPVVGLLDEIETLSGDHRATVRQVGPLVHRARCLRPGDRRLVDPDRAYVDETDLRARAREDTLEIGRAHV